MSAGKVDLKVVLLGKEYGGKTSLVERYVHGKFTESAPYQATIGAAFGARRVTVGSQTVTLGIWDTAGSERYESMSRIYYRGAKAAIVCYDLTDSASFERAKFWVNELKTSEEDCNVYLCGTKCDIVEENKMARDVDKRVVEEYREEIGAKDNMETSAKTGHNVVELFTKIAEDYVEAMKRESAKPDEDKVDLTLQRPGTHKKKSGCSCN